MIVTITITVIVVMTIVVATNMIVVIVVVVKDGGMCNSKKYCLVTFSQNKQCEVKSSEKKQ